MATVQEGFQDVLLDVVIVVDDGRYLLAELRKILHSLFNAVVGDVVGRWLGAQVQVIAHILLDKSAAVVAADDRIGQIQIFDHGFQLTPILPGYPATEDGGDLVGLTNGAIGIQQTFSHRIQSGSPVEDQVVAVLDLSKEKTMLAAGVPAFCFRKERCEIRQPFLAAGQQISGRQGIGEFLQSPGVTTLQKGIGARTEVDAFLAHPVGEPVMLIKADSRGEGKVWAHAHEHTSPARIVDIDAVLVDPALSDLKMPAIVLLVPIRNQDPGWFPRSQDRHHLIGLGSLEVRVKKIVPSALRSLQDRHAPSLRAVRDPASEPIGYARQGSPGHPLSSPIGIEETDHSLRLLKWLDQTAQ